MDYRTLPPALRAASLKEGGKGMLRNLLLYLFDKMG